MLEYSILQSEGILLLKPDASPSKEDFAGLSASLDAYLADHASLHGALIHTKRRPAQRTSASVDKQFIVAANLKDGVHERFLCDSALTRGAG